MNAWTTNIQQLSAGQVSKFNIFTKDGHSIRYMIDILDHKLPQVLHKNSCAVFIVPQGQESSQIYGSQYGLRQVLEQVGVSRLIVAKLVIGQQFQNLEGVKEELNGVLSSIIQKGCNLKQVPYLTDGSIGSRHYLTQDQYIFVEETLIQGQAFRRLVLKNSLSLVQSQFRLGYLSEKNHPQLAQLQTGVLPNKKNLLIGIDNGFLDDSYCRIILSALLRILPQSISDSSILHLGVGGGSIPKFIAHNYPNTTQTLVQINQSVIQAGKKYFEWPSQSPRFQVVHADALAFIQNSAQVYDAIIVDINGDEDKGESFPPENFLQINFLKGAVAKLKNGGILVYNLVGEWKGNDTREARLLYQQENISLVYEYSEQGVQNRVVFGVKKQLQSEGESLLVQKNLKNSKIESRWEWEEQSIQKIILVFPQIGGKFKIGELNVIQNTKEQKKKKKKKK